MNPRYVRWVSKETANKECLVSIMRYFYISLQLRPQKAKAAEGNSASTGTRPSARVPAIVAVGPGVGALCLACGAFIFFSEKKKKKWG